MSLEKVKEYFKAYGIEDRIIELSESSATVELAAHGHCSGRGIGMTADEVQEEALAEFEEEFSVLDKAGFVADACSNRSKRGNSAYGSTHRNGNKATDSEKACYRHVARQNGKAEVDGAFYTASSADSAGKGTCGKEDEAHGENIFVTYAGRSKAQLLHKAELFVLQESYD